MTKRKRVVVIGGGTGSFTVLSGLKKYEHLDLTAVVSMADDGGSTGILRDEYGVLPPGDIRQCLVALSETDDVMRRLFNFRFADGTLKGHNFGNIFISALEKMTGDFNDSLSAISKVLKVRGSVLPVTLDNVRLVAELNNRKKVYGQFTIAMCNLQKECGIKKIYFDKVARANPKAVSAIKNADLVIVGPGSFYSSLVPNFLVKGIPEALIETKAKKVFICNLMNQFGQTGDFSVADFVREIEKFIETDVFDHILYNTELPPISLLKQYSDEGTPVMFGSEALFKIRRFNLAKIEPSYLKKASGFDPVVKKDIGVKRLHNSAMPFSTTGFDHTRSKRYDRFVGANLIADKIPKSTKGDLIKRTLIRHDSDKLAKVIVSLLK